MSCILRLFQSHSHSYDQGTPIDRRSPLQDIPSEHQGAAVALFRKLYAQYHPTSTSYNTLHMTESCSFDEVQHYFQSHIDNWQQDPVAVQIERDLLSELPKVAQNNEMQAYKQLKAVIHEFGAYKIPEDEIDFWIKEYHADPRNFAHQHPQLLHLLFKYQTARNVYDVVVSRWAEGYLQRNPSRNRHQALANRVQVLIKDAKPCWLLNFFGYKSDRSEMLEFRQKVLKQRAQHAKSASVPQLAKPFRSAFALFSVKYPKDIKEADAVFLFNALLNSKIPHVGIPCHSTSDIHEIINGSIDQYGFAHEAGLLYNEFQRLLNQNIDCAEVGALINSYDRPWKMAVHVEHTPQALETFNRIAEKHKLAIHVQSQDALETLLQNPSLISARSVQRARVLEQFIEQVGRVKFRHTSAVPIVTSSKPKAAEKKKVAWADTSPQEPLVHSKTIPGPEESPCRVTKERLDAGPLRPRKTPRRYSEADRSRWHHEGNLDLYPSFTSLVRDLKKLEKEEQEYAIYQLGNLQRECFGKTFPIVRNYGSASAFLTKLIEVEYDQKEAFAQRFREVLNQAQKTQAKRLERETAYGLTSRPSTYPSWG